MNEEQDGSVATDQVTDDQSTQTSQESSPAPSTVSFSEEQVRQAMSVQQRIAQQALDQAAQDRAEITRLRQQYESRTQSAPTYNFQEMNERAANGQFAEVQADIARNEMARLMQPLLQENEANKRERNTVSFVDKAISMHLHPDFVRPGREYLITYVKGALGSAEPSEFVVKSLVDAAVGNAIAANPQALTDFYNQQRGQQHSTPTNQQSTATVQSPKPIPPRIPNGRPLVNPNNSPSTLDASEKKLMELMGLTGKITDEEFRAGMLDPDQKFTLNLNSIRNTGANN